MRIQAYTQYGGMLTVTIATVRPDEKSSAFFSNAKIHEDYSAQVMAYLEEHRHVTASQQQAQVSAAYASGLRIQTYFPAPNGSAFYGLSQLMPYGIVRDVDEKFQLEITRIRYQFVLNVLTGAWAAGAVERNSILRSMEYAVKQLFETNAVSPKVFVPGSNDIRPWNDGDLQVSEVDVICELGEASGRTGVDIPTP